MTDRFIRLPEVIKVTTLSRATIHRMEAQGKFPARVQIGTNMVAWRQSEIERWIADPTGWTAQAA